jgi:hypothetical protein
MIPRYDRLSVKNTNLSSPEQNETNMAEMIVHYLNFNNIAQNLFSKNENKFIRFFEKLYNIDRRALILFIQHHKDNISKQNLQYSSCYFESRGYIPKWYIT